MKITHVVDPSYKITLEYKTGRNLKYIPNFGKTFSRKTQCILYVNDFVVATGSVRRHYKDKDNLAFAVKAATKKVISKISFRDVRKQLWDLVFKKVETLDL